MPFFRTGDDYLKAIILYCSRSGNTEALAHRVCQTIPCDTLKVEPKEPYGNYLQSILRVRKERKKDIVPETATPVPDLSSYDTVFVGFPVWFSDIPAFFSEFLSRCDLKEKKLIPFSTATNSNILKSLTTLKKVCPQSIIKYPFDHIRLKRCDTAGWLGLIKADKSL